MTNNRNEEMIFDLHLFQIADNIASNHTKRGWFESHASVIVRLIRLRTSIYHALLNESNPYESQHE